MSPVLLLALFFLNAAAYLAFLPQLPYKGDYLVKSLPIFCLAGYTVWQGEGAAAALLFVGLLFSAGGDVALALDRRRYFVIGLSLFLIAHLFYLAAFSRELTQIRLNLGAGVILLLALAMGGWLWPVLGKLRLPVMLYLLVISLMGVAAAFHPRALPYLFPGAVLFILSDALIATDKFRRPVPYAQYLIMSTYYLGQLGIVLGVIG
ncbi:MAG: lysoplasmalogenase [Anaerolineae bacterium]|nr:lysoplasmalogenase [Anaerolineae bacterium]